MTPPRPQPSPTSLALSGMADRKGKQPAVLIYADMRHSHGIVGPKKVNWHPAPPTHFKSEFIMSIRKDADNTEHRVVVHAKTLYEAVIRRLKLLEDVGWEQ